MSFEVVTGEWEFEDETVKGMVDKTKTARCRRGSESDEDYFFTCVLNISAGQAALLVNYGLTPDWKERYLRFRLVPDKNDLYIESILRNPDGSIDKEVVLGWRIRSLSFDTDYDVKVLSSENAVYCYLRGMMVFRIEGLAEDYSKGLHGFELLGEENNSSIFKKIRVYKRIV